MDTKAGVWIDRKRAFIVFPEGDTVKVENILSGIEKRVRAAGGSRTATPYGPQEIVAEDRVERKFRHHLERYYQEVATALRDRRTLLLMGPGEAKEEFGKFLEKKRSQPPLAVVVEAADKMTDNQIVARVKKHFLG